MNRETFQKNIMVLQGMYSTVLDKTANWVYWTALKNHSDADMDFAVERVIKKFIPTSACPFPVPAHFIEQIENRVSFVSPQNQHYLPLPKDDLPTQEEISQFMADFKSMVKRIAREKSMKGSK